MERKDVQGSEPCNSTERSIENPGTDSHGNVDSYDNGTGSEGGESGICHKQQTRNIGLVVEQPLPPMYTIEIDFDYLFRTKGETFPLSWFILEPLP